MPIQHIVRCEVRECDAEAPAIDLPGFMGNYQKHPIGWAELEIQAEPTKEEEKEGRTAVARRVTLCPVHVLRAIGD